MIRPLTDNEKSWVAKTLSKMSIREKIGQTAQENIARLPFKDFTKETISEFLKNYPIGSIFVRGPVIKSARRESFQGFGDTAETYRENIQFFQKHSKLPLLVAGDLESGAGAVVPTLTTFPNAMAVGAANDEKLAYEMGKYTALEGRAAGFNWTFAPVADLSLNWMNPAVGIRSLGDNPERVTQIAISIVKGMQENGLAATAKHFPGDGVDFRDQHICTSINSLTENEWWEKSGAVFKSLIDNGVYAIMTGHVALKWLEPMDEEKNKYRPGTTSKMINTELLRNKLNFKGVLVSDALDMGGFVTWDTYEKRIIDVFNSGVDIMLWPGIKYFDLMEEAIAKGIVTENRLNESVRRILEFKARLDLLDIDDNGCDPHALKLDNCKLSAEMDIRAKALSHEIAEKSLTLVRNRKNSLPLDSSVKKILVAKLNSVTEGRSFSNMDYFIEKLSERGLEITIVDQFEPVNVFERMEQVDGQRWDAFLLPFFQPMHGLMNTVRPTGDIAKGLWAMQHIKTLDPIVISMATPYMLHELPSLNTLVNAYSCSKGTIDILVKALFGEVPFSDYSPVTVGGWE